ncbi:MAG: AAA family ATPase [Clostridia bacterium]|nr:AAA family ATPase [Clostridia bacterium]
MTAWLNALLSALPVPPGWRYDFAAIESLPPLEGLIRRMKATGQHPVWHGEGDVWTHTRLVCEALCDLERFRQMPSENRTALALAALFHDTGKPDTTRLEDGCPVSPHHALAGSALVRELLWRELGCCGSLPLLRLRETVCGLIRWHSLPPNLPDREAPETTLLRLASLGQLAPGFSLESLCLLAEADILGRVSPDAADRLESVRLTEAMAAEAGCLRGPYPFRSARTARMALQGKPVWKDQELFDDSWGEVLMLSGLPGTGKDTWIREHATERETVSLDAVRRKLGVAPTEDQGRVIQAAKEEARALLRARQSFVWNATCLTERTRGSLVSLFENYGARVRILWLETDWEENLRRNEARKERVPVERLCRMLSAAVPPAPHEAQTVKWACV